MSNSTIEQIEAALNDRQHWLTLTTEPACDGTVRLVVDIRGHFATVAASDSTRDVAGAIVALFDSMAVEVQRAASGVVGRSAASHPVDGVNSRIDESTVGKTDALASAMES